MILLATYVVAIAFAALVGLAVRLGPRRGGPLLGAGALAAAGALIAASGLQGRVVFDDDAYFHDYFSILETINKAATGLASSTDYLSPIGPVYDWTFQASLALRPPDATTLNLAGALFAGVVAIYGILLLRRQVSAATLGLVVLVAVATILSPRDLDRVLAQTQMNWLAPYNRWASGVMVFPVMALCVPALPGSWVRAALLGVGIAVLMLLKITYGVAILGLVVVAVVLRTAPARGAAVAVAAMASTLVVLDVATGGQLRAYAGDISAVARMPSNGMRIPKFVLQAGEAFLWAAGSVVLYLVACKETGRRPELRAVAIMLIAAAMGSTILMQNHWSSESTVYAVLPLVAAEWSGLFRASTPGAAVAWNGRHAALVAVASGLALVYPTRDSGTLIAQYVQASRLPADRNFADYSRANFLVPDRVVVGEGSLSGIQYRYLLDGLEALQQAGVARAEHGAILALYFANPFPFLLDGPSPRRAPVWLDEGRTFSDDVHLSAEEMFDGVNTVMRSSDPRHGAKLWEIYGPYVESHYHATATVGTWTVYVRRG